MEKFGQIERSLVSRGHGIMGISLIETGNVLMLCLGDEGLNFQVGVESRHVTPFGELG